MAKSNPIKDMMEGSSYYESTSVGSTRKNKTCDVCDGNIPKGSRHIGAKVYRDEYTQVNICNACEERYVLQLKDMRIGKYDSY